jgi:double zinc ribbon protein
MDFEGFLLDALEGIGNTDFASIGQYFLIGFIVFWFAILWWVWFDVSARTTKIWAKIASVLLVTVLNVFGLIIYLVVRPDQTIEGTYWEDLERRYMKYETSELGDCPKCKAQLYPGYIFCSDCGYRLKVQCPKCELFVDRNSKFCSFCGTQVRRSVAKEEIEIEPEVMEEQVKATKEEITNVVESDETKYSRSESIVGKIGESVIGGYKIMFEKIVEVRREKKIARDKKGREKKNLSKEKEVMEKGEKFSKEKEEEIGKRKEKAKKKRRKKKKKGKK